MSMFTSLEFVALIFLGLITLWVLKSLCVIIYIYIIGPIVNNVDFKSKGKWALITGATDGIGKEYAKQLAAKGCDIILVSRSWDKLNATAQEIENDYKVATKVIQVDFTSGDQIYYHIANEIKDMDIGTLVNNVGMAYPYPDYFLNIENMGKLTNNLINANSVSVIRMTELVLPQMVKKRKGVIVNVSSMSAIMNVPMIIIYAATKAFVDHFTVGLQHEYKNCGVIIQSLLTGGVVTKLSGFKESFIQPSAENYVKSALSTIGTESRTTGYIAHTIGKHFYSCLNSISSRYADYMLRTRMEEIKEQLKPNPTS